MKATTFLPFLFCIQFSLVLSSQSNIQQSLSINAAGTAPDASAQLDVSATDKGMLVPRMTSAQRTAISSPATGLLVFDTTSGSFWFYGSSGWTRITDTNQGNGGKTYLVLSGNISDAEAAQRIQDDVGVNTQFIWVQNTTQLTSLNFPNVTQAVEIKIENNAALSTVDFPALTNVWQNISISNHQNLTALNCPLLTTSDYLLLSGNSVLATLSLPGLTYTRLLFVQGNTALTTLSMPALSAIGSVTVESNNALTALSLPALTSSGNFTVQFNAALTSISLPSLTSGSLNIVFNAALTNLNLPALATIGNVIIQFNASLPALSLPALTGFSGSSFTALNNALNSASVNSLLASLVSIAPSISGKNINLKQNPAAPPTGQGIIDKNTLIANGNTVNTD